MGTDFIRKIDAWHLFIALTLDADVVRRDEFSTARALARQSFACFINLLTVAGVMLIPEQSPSGVGIPLVCIGGFSLLFTVRSIIGRLTRSDWGNVRRVLQHTALMILGMAALVTVGIGIWGGHDRFLMWLTVATLTLLSAASHNAWTLLIGPRDAGPT